jgi:hypothetical protein
LATDSAGISAHRLLSTAVVGFNLSNFVVNVVYFLFALVEKNSTKRDCQERCLANDLDNGGNINLFL